MKSVEVATPNFSEAKQFGSSSNPEDLALEIHRKFGCNVVITGGEIGGKDVVCENGKIYFVEADLIHGDFHGTGCVYSTALACYLAKDDLENAVRRARIFVLESVKEDSELDKGFYESLMTISLPKPSSTLALIPCPSKTFSRNVLTNLLFSNRLAQA